MPVKSIYDKNVNINFKKVLIRMLIAILSARTFYFIYLNEIQNQGSYISLLNNEIPYIKSVGLSDKGGERADYKEYIARILGVDGLNFFTVIKSEVPYFNELPDKSQLDKNIASSVDPFELSDKSIIKYTPEEMTEEGANVSSQVYNPKLKKTLNVDKPEVLIYHSHTLEYYSPATSETTDANYSVVGVGDALTKELEENYGISVIHDKTIHSLSYDDSYKRSGETISRYLNKYDSFKIIIDLHRDAVQTKTTVTTSINGESLARIMFVLAHNSQYYSKNKELTDKLNTLSRNIFPGLSRGINEYRRGKEAFNQGKSPNAILIEVGANSNTYMEAQNTAKYIARLIAEAINTNQ